MTDSTVETVEAPTGTQDENAATLAALGRSVHRHKVWLIALTVVVAVCVLGTLSVAGLTLGVGVMFAGPGELNAEQVADAKQEIRDAYGDRLTDLEVREVNVDYGASPFPFSMMLGESTTSLYISYGLKGSNVQFADLMDVDMFGGDVSASGMLPTKGSLVSRMSPEQLDRLLAAYSAETRTPLSAVRRYGDVPFAMETGQAVPDEVTVGDRTFPTKELWSVTEGRVIKGDSVDMNDQGFMARQALIFHEDPATKKFVFLGTEPAETLW